MCLAWAEIRRARATRSFAYDSLQRLTSVTNPGSGTTTYTYDGNGNVLTKTDARGIQTAYTYDALNRLTEKSYSDGSLGTYFFYDQPGVANGIGRLYEAWAENAYTLNSGYDPLGRVTQSEVVLYYQTYTFNYSYNLAGSLTSETYPSGRTVNTTYDTSNRAYAVSGTNSGQATNYVTQTGYWPNGARHWHWYGNGMFPVWNYNSRMQPEAVYSTINNQDNQWLFFEQLGWGGANGNGNLQSATVYEGGPSSRPQMATFSQTFLYEAGNRLLAAYDSNWGRTFAYDQYGNMSVTSNSGVPLNGLTPVWQNGRPVQRSGQPAAVGELRWRGEHGGDRIADECIRPGEPLGADV